MKIQYISTTCSLFISCTVLTKWTLVSREVQKVQKFKITYMCACECRKQRMSIYLFAVVLCLKYSFKKKNYVCVSSVRTRMQVSVEPEKTLASLKLKVQVIGSRSSQKEHWCPLKEQQVFITTEPSLQSFLFAFEKRSLPGLESCQLYQAG